MPTCGCRFPDRETERSARHQFLKDYGDDLPSQVIEEMVSDALWDRWATKCDCNDPTRLIAVGHYKPLDWYTCVVRGLAVKKEERGKGLGREIAGEVLEKAEQEKTYGDPRCLVFVADVTFDNLPSQRSLKRYGFQPVGEFCWGKGHKPADIMHLLRFKPTKDKSCLEP